MRHPTSAFPSHPTRSKYQNLITSHTIVRLGFISSAVIIVFGYYTVLTYSAFFGSQRSTSWIISWLVAISIQTFIVEVVIQLGFFYYKRHKQLEKEGTMPVSTVSIDHASLSSRTWSST